LGLPRGPTPPRQGAGPSEFPGPPWSRRFGASAVVPYLAPTAPTQHPHNAYARRQATRYAVATSRAISNSNGFRLRAPIFSTRSRLPSFEVEPQLHLARSGSALESASPMAIDVVSLPRTRWKAHTGARRHKCQTSSTAQTKTLYSKQAGTTAHPTYFMSSMCKLQLQRKERRT